MGSIVKMLRPGSVALIGATDREGSVGRTILENLIKGQEKRQVFAVNPDRESVLGVRCYPRIGALPAKVDMAIVATPAKLVPEIVEECALAGVEGIVAVSAGFRESGQEGMALEEQIRRCHKKHGIRVLGPNCVGFVRPGIGLNASFLKSMPEAGSIAFISQSGALGSAVLDWAISTGVGFSMFASLGSMVDIDYGDLIDYLGEDQFTKSIIVYMESVGAAKKFMSAARGFARSKPIIVVKAGRHEAGGKAARSHTGALAGDFEVYDAAFKRVGVVRVEEVEDLFNCASALQSVIPKGPKLAVVTNAGGPAVMAADYIVEKGLQLAELSDSTLNLLNSQLPSYWSHSNPVDVLGDADASRYQTALKLCLDDPNVDGVIAIYTSQGGTSSEEVAKEVVGEARGKWKPVLTVWMGGKSVDASRQIFYQNNIPCYLTPEKAVRTYSYMYKYHRSLELLYQTPDETRAGTSSPPQGHLRLLIRKAAREGRTMLGQSDVNRFLDVYRIPRPWGMLAENANEAGSFVSRRSVPMVLKIASPDISHKTDVGGVVMGVQTSLDAEKEYDGLITRAEGNRSKPKIDGVYVQEMVKNIDYELILGSKKDKDFGSIILFGSGGTGVELFRDFSIGLPPLNQVLARRLMEDTKIFGPLSKGFRNKAPVELSALEDVMIRFSNMIVDFPELEEVDINPLAVADGKVLALDVRIIIDPKEALKENIRPYSNLVIRPYPTKYIFPWLLKDGTEVLIRPIKPEDEPMEDEFIQGLSEQSRRFRFFGVIKEMTHKDLVRFCNIDYDREMGLIAEAKENGRRVEVAVGRVITDPMRQKGEFAVVVADRYQNMGLGMKLVDVLITAAQEMGLKSIYGTILPENLGMIQMCKELGFTIRHSGDEVTAELNLR